MVQCHVQCQGTFNFKGSNMFFFCVLFLKDSLFLISSWKTGTSRAAHTSQDWDHEKGHLLGFLSVTPFSDLFSYAPLTQDIECFLALWRLLFAWLCFCSFFFYWLKLPCIKIYKHAFIQIKQPCFTRDLGPLCPSSRQLQCPGPGLQRWWQVAPEQGPGEHPWQVDGVTIRTYRGR